MSDDPMDHSDLDVPPVEVDPDVAAAQDAHLRRILGAFFAVIVLLPLSLLGGGFSVLLLPLLAIAAYAFREAVQLRRSVRTHGARRR